MRTFFQKLPNNLWGIWGTYYILHFFEDLMTHLIREYAGTKIKYFFNVSPFTIDNILL